MGFFDDLGAKISDTVATATAPTGQGNAWQNAGEQVSQASQKAKDFKVNNWKNGIDIVPLRGEDATGLRNSVLESLRAGDDIAIGDEIISGGIKDLRYLGKGEDDILNSNYFSHMPVSENGNVLQVSISDATKKRGNSPSAVGDFSVYYDDNGAIAEIVADSDVIFKNGKRYKNGQRVAGPAAISKFFKDMDIAADDSDYMITNKRNGISGRFGGLSSSRIGDQAPTRIFGSRGVLQQYRQQPTAYTRNSWVNSYGTNWDDIRAWDGTIIDSTPDDKNAQAYANYKAWQAYQDAVSNNNDVSKLPSYFDYYNHY